jgi:hypothetical protein
MEQGNLKLSTHATITATAATATANNNSIQFFIIYVPGQLQTQHSADTCNYINTI